MFHSCSVEAADDGVVSSDLFVTGAGGFLEQSTENHGGQAQAALARQGSLACEVVGELVFVNGVVDRQPNRLGAETLPPKFCDKAVPVGDVFAV